MIFTKNQYEKISEYVAPGHPDKIADQISDALLDGYIEKNNNTKVAIECLISGQNIVVAGEVSDRSLLNDNEIIQIIKKTINKIGYEKHLLDSDNLKINILLNKQSEEISQSISDLQNQNTIIAAGDQCMVFGYATDETPNYMPAPIYFAKKIIFNTILASNTKGIPFTLGPDGKSQVIIKYESGKPITASHILLSMQHPKNICSEEIKNAIMPYIISSFPKQWNISTESIIINPSKNFSIGGPIADCGLTGRKVIVDTYGSFYNSGGGAFSGKDPSKMDRSGAYMARYIAKNIVASGIAKACGITIGYAIGIKEPIFFDVETFGTSKKTKQQLINIIKANVPLDPNGIIEYLNLKKPIYHRTSLNGHFGIDPDSDGGYSWERLDLSETLLKNLSKVNEVNVLFTQNTQTVEQ